MTDETKNTNAKGRPAPASYTARLQARGAGPFEDIGTYGQTAAQLFKGYLIVFRLVHGTHGPQAVEIMGEAAQEAMGLGGPYDDAEAVDNARRFVRLAVAHVNGDGDLALGLLDGSAV